MVNTSLSNFIKSPSSLPINTPPLPLAKNPLFEPSTFKSTTVPNLIDSSSESSTKLPDFISSESIVNPPMLPTLDDIVPLISTFEAVMFPVWSTLKALVLINVVCVESFISTPVVVNECASIVNPPIAPSLAVILPVMLALEAVICPLEDNTKVFDVSLILTSSIVNPPILPLVAFIEPSKNALPLA